MASIDRMKAFKNTTVSYTENQIKQTIILSVCRIIILIVKASRYLQLLINQHFSLRVRTEESFDITWKLFLRHILKITPCTGHRSKLVTHLLDVVASARINPVKGPGCYYIQRQRQKCVCSKILLVPGRHKDNKRKKCFTQCIDFKDIRIEQQRKDQSTHRGTFRICT